MRAVRLKNVKIRSFSESLYVDLVRVRFRCIGGVKSAAELRPLQWSGVGATRWLAVSVLTDLASVSTERSVQGFTVTGLSTAKTWPYLPSRRC